MSRSDTRTHILQVACAQIYRSGFRGVSVEQIVARTGLTKGAFFHYFPTKNDIGYAVVDECLLEAILDRWIRPLASRRNVLRGILDLYVQTFEHWTHENLAYGCPLHNLSQEMSAIDPVFRQKIHAVLEHWIQATERCLLKAQQDGHLKSGVDARELAEFIVTMQESAFAMGKATNDPSILRSLCKAMRRHLHALAATSR